MRFGITGAKTRAWFEIRPLGCRESAGSNLARSTGLYAACPTKRAARMDASIKFISTYLAAVCVPV
jgi:hypothetical protein